MKAAEDQAAEALAAVKAEGTTVLRAAAENGIHIPKLCATDTLEPFGSCRLCVVEIEGQKGTPASCTRVSTSSTNVVLPQVGDPARQVMALRGIPLMS